MVVDNMGSIGHYGEGYWNCDHFDAMGLVVDLSPYHQDGMRTAVMGAVGMMSVRAGSCRCSRTFGRVV